MSLGDIFLYLFQHIYSLWPLRIVNQWEQGVRTRAGKIQRPALTSDNGLFGTGIHAFWPILGDLETRESNIEVLETDLQTIRTLDGEDVTFSLGARFRLRDAAALYEKIHDPDDSITEAIRASAGRACHEMEDADQARRELPEAALHEARKTMRGWGVELMELDLINFSTATGLRLIWGGE